MLAPSELAHLSLSMCKLVPSYGGAGGSRVWLAGRLATATATLIMMLDLDAEGEQDTYVY